MEKRCKQKTLQSILSISNMEGHTVAKSSASTILASRREVLELRQCVKRDFPNATAVISCILEVYGDATADQCMKILARIEEFPMPDELKIFGGNISYR